MFNLPTNFRNKTRKSLLESGCYGFRPMVWILLICLGLAGAQAATNQSDPRIALLCEELSSGKKDPAKVLQNALKENDREYRTAILDAVSPYADTPIYIKAIRSIPKASPAVKADIMNWIGKEATDPGKRKILNGLEVKFEQPSRQVFINQLAGTNTEVKQAALFAMSRIGDPHTLPAMVKLLTGESEENIQLAQEALAVFSGDIDRAVARAIPQAARDAGKIAGLELLALRKANANSSAVYTQTQSGSPAVREAALKALKDVVNEADFVRLCGMLETASPEAIAPLQEAIVVSISSQSPEEKFNTITRRMLRAGESHKHLYYIPLATTKQEKAGEIIREGLKNSREEVREEARKALEYL